MAGVSCAGGSCAGVSCAGGSPVGGSLVGASSTGAFPATVSSAGTFSAGASSAGASPKIAVVDYHKGNIRSVERALEVAGANVVVSDNPRVVVSADAVVLPGVGAFTDAANTLDELGLTRALIESVERGVPFLGICLGLHLLFEAGEEHASGSSLTKGLGILPGVVRKIPRTDSQGRMYKIPHVGWNRISVLDDKSASKLFDGVDDGSFFYFTHSYIAPDSDATIATTTHSVTFPCAVRVDNVYGVQFHPEKSSDVGLTVMKNFVNIATESN